LCVVISFLVILKYYFYTKANVMIDDATLEKVKTFSPKNQDEVRDFIEFIEEKKEPNLKEPRQAGILKGFVKYMSPDFDEPLEDFKDYM
jgi:Protein of unknown function (DUF2281)